MFVGRKIAKKDYNDSESGFSLVLLVKFNDSDEEYQLSMCSRGSFSDKLHIRYRFDKASEANKDVCDFKDDAYTHKIGLSSPSKHSWSEFLKLPVDRATYRFQKQITEDSIYITSWSIIHASIEVFLSYRLASGVDLTFSFSLENEDYMNFRVGVLKNSTRYLVTSLITMANPIPLLLSPKKFLKVCQKYVDSYLKHYKGRGFQLPLMG